MDFAADAVFDAVAPQPRAASARAAPSDRSEPSFDDHLDAATEDAPTDVGPSETDKPNVDEKASAATSETPDQAVPVAPQQTPTPSPQFVVQLVAPDVAASPPAAPADAPEIAPVQPQSAQPAQPPLPQTADAPESPPINAAAGIAAPKTQPAQQKSEGDAPKANAAPALDVAEPAPPPAVQSNTTPAPAPVTTPAPMSAEAAEAIASVAPQAAPTQPAVRDTAVRGAKSEVRAEGAAEPTAVGNAAAAQPPAARIASKSAPTQQGQNNKDSAITAAAPAIDTPEIPAPAPQPTALSTPAASQTQHASLEHNAVRAPPAAAQVAREIVRHFDGGNTRFELRLDPPELGRVEIRLEVSRDHRVTAVIAADSPQALHELSRHARELEQMLQSSGLELTDNGLSFDLRQGSEGSDESRESSTTAHGGAVNEDAQQQQTTTARPLGFERWRGVRVDMMV